MRIIQLRPFHFRAFGDSSQITFASNLTIFYGGNGTGKSSLAEALEWLFYGYTKRRRKGDQYSVKEYKGCYIHKGCPAGIVPCVEADILFADGTRHILRRSMRSDERGKISDTDSTLSLDGVEILDLSGLGVSSDAYCPIVVQHGIQDFIHTRPIDRYRAISEALGLADLTKFKDALEQAKNRYKNNPPTKVTTAKTSLAKSVTALERIGLTEIAVRWKNGDVEDPTDSETIFHKAQELTGSQANGLDDLLKDVKNRQALEISKLFDVAPYRPPVNLDNILRQAQDTLSNLSQEHKKVLAAASDLAKAIISKYTDLQLSFWNQGLGILEQRGTITQSGGGLSNCPFCDEPTLTQNKLEEIRTNTANGKGIGDKRNSLTNALADFDTALSGFDTLWPHLEFTVIPEQQVHSLRKMFSRGEKRLDEFVEENSRAAVQTSSFKNKVSELKKKVGDLRKVAITPEEAVQAIDPILNLIQDLLSALTENKAALHEYSTTFDTFLPILQRELSDEATVAAFTGLAELLATKPQIDLVMVARKFEADILKSQQVADEYILNQQRIILGDREKDILAWYDRLSPNPDVKFSGLEPGKNEFNLKAIAFGQELNAAASLSQSQLNCLGLSVYIPSIVAPSAPFDFIVFDDPVQAMDDDHHEAFLIKVVPELLGEQNRQVVVLTHLKPTADRLFGLNYNLCPTYYRLDKLFQNGPQIREYVLLRDEAKQIKDLAEGNEESRDLAVDRVRVFCEHVMREAHLKIKGSMMPENLQGPRQMLQAFRKLPGVTPNHAQILQDTIGWSDPSHHADPNWQVRGLADIQLHIQRLQSIIGALGLRCE